MNTKSRFLPALLAGLIISVCTGSVFAQSTRRPPTPVKLTKEQAAEVKKQAADMYKGSLYKMAIVEYEKLVNYDPEDGDFNYKLGMCYMNTPSDKSKAIQYFVKAADKKDAPKDVYYHMGNALLAAGLFDEAVEAFEKYKEVNKGQVNAKFNLDQHVEYCYNGKEYKKKPVDVKIINPGKLVNTPKADYAPVTMALDTVVFFTSSRQGNTGGIVDGLGEIIPDIYFSSRTDTTWIKAKNAGINVNSEYYDISTGLSSNGDKLLVYKENAEYPGDIFLAQLKGKSWTKAELFVEDLAGKQPETGACISPDGKRVYFAAELKGTLGGKDIYVVEKDESGKWSAPANLGPAVNTKFNEDNPFIWHDGKTLFFASEGHTSIGGFDIFMTTRASTEQDWSKPVNIGYPLNTFDDDLYFTMAANGRTGYVCGGYRPGCLGDLDIWYFRLAEPMIKGAGTLFRASILTPQGLPAKDALCSVVKESTGEVLGIMEANGANAEIFILLPPGNYKLKARSAKAGRLEVDVAVTGDEGEKGISKVLTLQPNPSSKP
jgi:hypothetical protein